MPRDFPRTRRVAEQIRRSLSAIIKEEVKDPRVGLVTVCEVDVSRDLGHAKIFVTRLNANAEENESCVQALNRASGFIRSLLGRQLTTRVVPQLHFISDNSFERADAISRLINEAVSSDSSEDTEPES